METDILKALSMMCPGCGTVVRRQGGCNWIICTKCKTEFCFQCGREVRSCAVRLHGGAYVPAPVRRDALEREGAQTELSGVAAKAVGGGCSDDSGGRCRLHMPLGAAVGGMPLSLPLPLPLASANDESQWVGTKVVGDGGFTTEGSNGHLWWFAMVTPRIDREASWSWWVVMGRRRRRIAKGPDQR